MTVCELYKPGTKPGKTRPVCKYYEQYLNGVCTSGKEFMCVFYIENWLKSHPIKEGEK